MIFGCFNSNLFSQCLGNSSQCVYSLAVDEDTLWIGTKVGLFKYDIANETQILFNTKNSNLPNNYVYTLKIGNDNSLWIGTYGGGLANLKNNLWTVFNKSNSSIASNNIFDIEIIHDTIFWLASDIGVITYDSHDWGLYNQENSSLTNRLVFSVTNEGDSIMWISANGGLHKYNGNWYQYTRENSKLPHNTVYTTEIIGKSKYIGTDEGLVIFNGYTWDHEFSEKTLVVKHEASNGNFCAGTASGLKRKIVGWQTYSTRNSIIENDYIQDLAIDKYGNKWIATWGGGVYRFDNTNFQKIKLLTSDVPFTNNHSFNIFPNPAINEINIKFNETLKTNSQIDLINSQGQIIKTIYIDKGQNETSIDVSNFNTGVIFIRITNESGITVRKVIKL